MKQFIYLFVLVAGVSRLCAYNSGLLWIRQNLDYSFRPLPKKLLYWAQKCFFFFIPTFSVSSFLTDLRLARRSKETLCLEPSSERRMASAETLTLLRLGLLNFPRRSRTLMFKSLICRSCQKFHCSAQELLICPLGDVASRTEVCRCCIF